MHQNSKFWEQKDGTALDLPLSPMGANISMESFEQKLFNKLRMSPDFGCTMQRTPLSFEQLLHASAMETETIKGSVTLRRCFSEMNGNKLMTSVFEERTHTDQYLHYISHHYTQTN